MIYVRSNHANVVGQWGKIGLYIQDNDICEVQTCPWCRAMGTIGLYIQDNDICEVQPCPWCRAMGEDRSIHSRQ